MDDKPLEKRVGLPLKATPRWKSLLLAVPLSIGLLGYALPAASAEQREVILLSKYEGLSFPQIAEILGCSVSAAKVRAFRALKALRAALGNMEELC